MSHRKISFVNVIAWIIISSILVLILWLIFTVTTPKEEVPVTNLNESSNVNTTDKWVAVYITKILAQYNIQLYPFRVIDQIEKQDLETASGLYEGLLALSDSLKEDPIIANNSQALEYLGDANSTFLLALATMLKTYDNDQYTVTELLDGVDTYLTLAQGVCNVDYYAVPQILPKAAVSNFQEVKLNYIQEFYDTMRLYSLIASDLSHDDQLDYWIYSCGVLKKLNYIRSSLDLAVLPFSSEDKEEKAELIKWMESAITEVSNSISGDTWLGETECIQIASMVYSAIPAIIMEVAGRYPVTNELSDETYENGAYYIDKFGDIHTNDENATIYVMKADGSGYRKAEKEDIEAGLKTYIKDSEGNYTEIQIPLSYLE